MVEREEDEIVKDALRQGQKRAHGSSRKIGFIDTETLMEDVVALYPRVNEVLIYNHDERDAEGGPVLVTRNIRGMTVSLRGRPGFYRDAGACYLVLAAVEQGTAYLKTVKLGMQEV